MESESNYSINRDWPFATDASAEVTWCNRDKHRHLRYVYKRTIVSVCEYDRSCKHHHDQQSSKEKVVTTQPDRCFKCCQESFINIDEKFLLKIQRHSYSLNPFIDILKNIRLVMKCIKYISRYTLSTLMAHRSFNIMMIVSLTFTEILWLRK